MIRMMVKPVRLMRMIRNLRMMKEKSELFAILFSRQNVILLGLLEEIVIK